MGLGCAAPPPVSILIPPGPTLLSWQLLQGVGVKVNCTGHLVHFVWRITFESYTGHFETDVHA
jgi:hypothetical protein